LASPVFDRAIPSQNPYFHREFGSRLLESGAAGIHDVSYWLGHTNVATTSQYLRTTVERLQRVARAFDESRRIASRLPTSRPEAEAVDKNAYLS
jgi:integrase